MTRKITSEEADALLKLPVHLPENEQHSVPFSYAVHELYRPAELLCEDGVQTLRTDEFMKRLLALYWVLGENPVPYAFKTADGSVRSMDAGCLGMLHHHREELVCFELDGDGYIRTVTPTQTLVSRYGPLKERLMQEISA